MDSTLQQTFWTWALKRYEDKGLRERLLVLQESCGLVVVEALFFAWLAEQGRQLTLAEALHGGSHHSLGREGVTTLETRAS